MAELQKFLVAPENGGTRKWWHQKMVAPENGGTGVSPVL
jgi:hypothetical protein